jgi:hypothetical protein
MGAFNFAASDLIMMIGGQLLLLYVVVMIFMFSEQPLSAISLSTLTGMKNSNSNSQITKK